ncbi:The fantastic four family [Thalictrum thalictroides]|uniref:The fantastic four family n=1 Tax=Thalictrum thalictroides TaxID=46969 RepID=A0A7J6WTA8_THATH|nr:The fantastic four family [Thalictrum thalictroides]
MGDQTPLAQSLPPSQLVSRLIPSSAAAAAAAASSFNTYDYCWRTKSPGAAAPTVCTHPLTQNPSPITKNNKFLVPKNMNPRDLVLMRGNKADYLVPVVKGCKEPRRSLLVWEPYCIATS